ncbi:MAG: hypothetical protein Q9221_003833 [Calogaya cf. arnoldii]
MSLIYGALLTASVRVGLGKHPYAIDPRNMSQVLKLYTFAVPFAILGLAVPTLAIAIVLIGLIGPIRPRTWIVYFFPILQIVIGVIAVILLFAQLYVAFVDVFLASVPLVAFWKLQIKPSAKVTLFLVMSATVLAAICALIRLPYIASLVQPEDYTYGSIKHTIWAVIESNVIIVAACMPDLVPFFKHLRSRSTKNRRPPPLDLGPKSSQYNSNASTALSSPLSQRRMEPRPSGSVSGSLTVPKSRAYRQNSLARIESTVDAPDKVDIEWQQGYGNEEGNVKIAKEDEEDAERRGRTRTSRMEAGEAVEVNGRDVGTIGDLERDDQLQELREVLDENSVVVDRQSWLEKMRERVDKRMTI